MQSVEMTLKNPEDNRHQLPGSWDQQAVAKDGFWVWRLAPQFLTTAEPTVHWAAHLLSVTFVPVKQVSSLFYVIKTLKITLVIKL